MLTATRTINRLKSEQASIQLSKAKAILYHLYPGVCIALGFIFLAPFFMHFGFPPQFGSLVAIILVALPLLASHLSRARKRENKNRIVELNLLTGKLPILKLILYSVGLVILMFMIWGITQPLDAIITQKLFDWLPAWYTVQDFAGYDKDKILVTLVFNLLLNGFLGPYVEELYFRGYLLPRMKSFGKYAFLINAVLFSLYHLWQPYVYLTLILALTPMIWLVWKTKSLKLAILTHSLLNIVGALLAFGLLNK